MSLVSDFVAKVQAVYKTGAATEHSYRSALEALLSGLEQDITALNEPKRVKCGAPDFIVQRGEIVVGHDVKHYRQIIKILLETSRIMQTITLTLDVPA